MDKQQAKDLVKNTLENQFDKGKFTHFVRNLLNNIDEAKAFHARGYVPESYKKYVKTYERLATYTDPEGLKIDILIVYLQNETTLERARTGQRNFIAHYLKDRDQKDAGLVAFVAPEHSDWRFSLVKMDYHFEEGKNGRMKVKEEFTPARRWSFLVGQNENSHTAQTRLLPIMADDGHPPSLAALEEAFNIETVTKEFFIEYRNLFILVKESLDTIVAKDSIIKNNFEQNDVNTVDFAKKLLGQIIFLYFLQKKGWFGVAKGAAWGTGSKQFLRELFDKKHGDYKNFFNDILEPLFYDALRNDRSHDDHYYSRFNCKIPFLNGGLFDPIKGYDWVKTDILLPNELFSNRHKTREGDTGNGILDVFDRYNFTVKEDEPLEKEVAIDPELLGKAYEKFNAIRPDNYEEYKGALKSGKKGEESKFNKQYGVYYTPREIVHYMCQQSLISYLYAEFNGGMTTYEKPGIDQTDILGNFGKSGQLDLTIEHKEKPDIPIEDIETLIHYGERITENEAVAIIKEESINTGKQKTAKTKSFLSESIRNNAYAIDAKLASIRVCDPAIGSGAFPVGMMNEIVRARNVLSNFIKDNRSAYNFKRACIENSLYGVDIDSGAVEIAKLRLWLSLVVDEDDIKQIKPLPNLDYKIVCGNSLIGFPEKWDSPVTKDIESLKHEFFDETNPTQKSKLKREIDSKINDRYKNSLKTFGYTVNFDFQTVFSEVFHEKGGFDVVIGNPPYKILTKNNSDLNELNYFIKKYKSIKCSYSKNLFTLFIEKALGILSKSSTLSFIVPEGLFKTRSYSGCVEEIEKNGFIQTIVTFTDYVFENAVTGNLIFVFSKNKIGQTKKFIFNESFELKTMEEEDNNLLRKIEKNTKPLKDISITFKGMVIKNRDLVLSENSRGKKNIFLLGKNICKWTIESKYFTNYNELEIIGGTKLLAKHNQIPRILIRRTGDTLCCSYLQEKALTESTLYSCWSTSNQISTKVTLGILNSKLLDYYNKKLYITNQQGFPQILMTDLELLPIKIPTPELHKKIENIVNKIHSLTQLDDYLQNSTEQNKVKECEKEIDHIVYKLYDLTPEEINIVENAAAAGKDKD